MVSIERPPTSSNGAEDWLHYIRNHGDDLSWLAQYEERLLAMIRRGVYSPPEFFTTVELLRLIFPYFVLVRLHTEPWLPVLVSALVQAQDLHHNDLQVTIFYSLGETYLKSGNHKSAHGSFEIALQRAEESRTDEMMLASYAGLFKLQWFERDQPLNRELVKQALDVARRVSDLALRATLHDSLAFAYVQVGETERALGHAQTAYLSWNGLNNAQEVARAAFTMAMCYRTAALYHELPHCLKRAEYFLNTAGSKIATTGLSWQHTLITYEQGVVLLQQEQYEAAEQWLMLALREATILKISYYIAIAQHALGLAQTGSEKYESSRQNLRLALESWTKLNNAYEQASVWQALGYLEGKAGQIATARKYLFRAARICRTLADMPYRHLLQKRIQESLDELVD